MTICAEMRDKPHSKLNTIYSKILLFLDMPETKSLIRDLLKVCNQIRDVSICYSATKYLMLKYKI